VGRVSWPIGLLPLDGGQVLALNPCLNRAAAAIRLLPASAIESSCQDFSGAEADPFAAATEELGALRAALASWVTTSVTLPAVVPSSDDAGALAKELQHLVEVSTEADGVADMPVFGSDGQLISAEQLGQAVSAEMLADLPVCYGRSAACRSSLEAFRARVRGVEARAHTTLMARIEADLGQELPEAPRSGAITAPLAELLRLGEGKPDLAPFVAEIARREQEVKEEKRRLLDQADADARREQETLKRDRDTELIPWVHSARPVKKTLAATLAALEELQEAVGDLKTQAGELADSGQDLLDQAKRTHKEKDDLDRINRRANSLAGEAEQLTEALFDARDSLSGIRDDCRDAAQELRRGSDGVDASSEKLATGLQRAQGLFDDLRRDLQQRSQLIARFKSQLEDMIARRAMQITAIERETSTKMARLQEIRRQTAWVLEPSEKLLREITGTDSARLAEMAEVPEITSLQHAVRSRAFGAIGETAAALVARVDDLLGSVDELRRSVDRAVVLNYGACSEITWLLIPVWYAEWLETPDPFRSPEKKARRYVFVPSVERGAELSRPGAQRPKDGLAGYLDACAGSGGWAGSFAAEGVPMAPLAQSARAHAALTDLGAAAVEQAQAALVKSQQREAALQDARERRRPRKSKPAAQIDATGSEEQWNGALRPSMSDMARESSQPKKRRSSGNG
jgi:hypothetical protein